MILAPLNGYTKALCIKTYKMFNNAYDMDHSIIKGTWYEAELRDDKLNSILL